MRSSDLPSEAVGLAKTPVGKKLVGLIAVSLIVFVAGVVCALVVSQKRTQPWFSLGLGVIIAGAAFFIFFFVQFCVVLELRQRRVPPRPGAPATASSSRPDQPNRHSSSPDYSPYTVPLHPPPLHRHQHPHELACDLPPTYQEVASKELPPSYSQHSLISCLHKDTLSLPASTSGAGQTTSSQHHATSPQNSHSHPSHLPPEDPPPYTIPLPP